MRISNCWKNFHFLLSYPLSFPLASMSVLRNMCVPCFQLIANTTSHSSAAHKVIVWEYLFETWLEHPWISRSYHLCESQSSAPPIVSRVCQKSSLSPQWILMLVHSRVNVKNMQEKHRSLLHHLSTLCLRLVFDICSIISACNRI